MSDAGGLWESIFLAPEIIQKPRPKGRIRRALEKARDNVPGEPSPFETAHPAVVTWLKNYQGNFPFYLSLKSQYEQRGDLSEKQVASIYNAIERETGKVIERAPADLLEKARAFDEWFKTFIGENVYSEISNPIVDAFRASIKPAATAKKVYTIAVGEIIRVNKTFAKRIGEAGGLTRAHFVFEVTDVFGETAKAYRVKLKAKSQRSGHCCVCGLALTNPESVTNGIGPDCGDGYQLDWKNDKDALTQLSEKLAVYSEVETWLPKSAIKERLKNEKS